MLMPPIDVVRHAFPSLSDVCELKKGGQKIAYTATSSQFGKVVLKLINPSQINERIHREIEIGSTNSFHNVPHIYESGSIELQGNTFLFIIEQFIDGKDLECLTQEGAAFTLEEVLKLMDSILLTLCELEKAHIVHRDIKPANIIYAKDGDFWLIDFGIARNLDMASLTSTSDFVGPNTLGYASPEQLQNEKKIIDSRSDLYSLGVVAYELLTGSNPFTQNVTSLPEILTKTLTFMPEELDIPKDTNRKLAKFIKILLDKSPRWRPPSAEAAYNWFKEVYTQLKEA